MGNWHSKSVELPDGTLGGEIVFDSQDGDEMRDEENFRRDCAELDAEEPKYLAEDDGSHSEISATRLCYTKEEWQNFCNRMDEAIRNLDDFMKSTETNKEKK